MAEQERFSMRVLASEKATKVETKTKVSKTKKSKYISKVGPDGVKYMVLNSNY